MTRSSPSVPLSPRTPWSMARSSARAVVETGAKLTGLSMLGDGAVAIAGALLDGAGFRRSTDGGSRYRRCGLHRVTYCGALHEAGREVVLIDNFDNSRPQPSMRSVPSRPPTWPFTRVTFGIDRSSTTFSRPATSTKSSTSPPTRRSGECDDSARVLRQQSRLHDRARPSHGRARCAQARLLIVVHGLWPA